MRKTKNPEEITYVYTSLRDELEEYKRKYNLMKTNANQLASRIDKALEYIKSVKYEWGDLEEDNEDFDIDVYKLLDILKGEDK